MCHGLPPDAIALLLVPIRGAKHARSSSASMPAPSLEGCMRNLVMDANPSPNSALPTKDAIDAGGLDLTAPVMEELLSVDRAAWETEIADIDKFFATFGSRLPAALKSERDALAARIKKA